MNSTVSSGEAARPNASAIACVCGQVNPTERRFCGQCGVGLWEACPRCNVAQPRQERFCGQCGIDVRQLRDEQQAWAEQQLAQVQQFVADCRFFDAARVVREVLEKLDGSSSPHIETCRKLLPSISESRGRMQAAAAAAFEQARQFNTQYDYKQAVKVLEAIPELMRDEATINLLDEMRSRAEEVSQLKTKIRDLVAARNYAGAIGRVERLLKLKPDHQEAKTLGGQLAAKLEQAARQKEAARDLGNAAQLLKQIPVALRTPDQVSLLTQFHEALWLLGQIMHGPVATESLVRLADRLTKLIGDDEKLRQIREELKRRVASDRQKGGSEKSPWRAKDLPSFAGLKCVMPTAMQSSERLRFDDEAVRTRYTSQFQRLGVATGLALQVLELADIDVNLVPRQKVGLLGRLGMAGKKTPPTTGWGIDLSPSGLKAVQLRRASEQQVVVERVVMLEHNDVSLVVLNEEEARERFAATLQNFVAQHLTDDSRVAVNLPGLVTLGRWFTLPPATGKRDDGILNYELKARIALPLEDLEWDHHEFDSLADRGARSARTADEPELAASNNSAARVESGVSMRRVFALAAKKFVVSNRLSLFTSQNIKVSVLQSEAVAWHNLLRFCLPNQSGTSALLDLGSDATHLIFSEPQGFWFRSFSPGGDEVTKGLAREFQVTVAQAERMKADPAAAPAVVSWGDVVATVKASWAREVQLSLSQLPREFLTSVPVELICNGGGAPLLTDWAPVSISDAK
jgi:Tfp pilus assembly PilM family ATPase